jgi:hypothetical protein
MTTRRTIIEGVAATLGAVAWYIFITLIFLF